MSHQDDLEDTPELLDADDALEEVQDGDGDLAMDSDDEPEEITLHNDSVAYFDAHKDSVFTIAQHPTQPSLIATGGSEGDADDAPGRGYVFDTAAVAGRPVLPPSFQSDPRAPAQPNTELHALFTIDGHRDSINALAFTHPRGEFLLSADMEGRMRAYRLAIDAHNKATFAYVGEVQETPEINWLAPCPVPAGTDSDETHNTVALGAADGSVWVYRVDPADAANPLQMVQSYFMHAAACTAGTWSPDGRLLATVAEDSSCYVWDVWGDYAARGLTNDNGQTVVSLTGQDQRFEVPGGLYSAAIDPRSSFLAVGGAGGHVRIVNLPRLSSDTAHPQNSRPSKAKAKAAEGGPSAGGQILAALNVQGDGVETLAFSPSQPLLAAGSVDGSVVVYDTARRFAVRRHIKDAHDEFSVVKVDFVRALGDGWLLTSCGMDGVVRRWDLRGAAPSAAAAAAAPGAPSGVGSHSVNASGASSGGAAGLMREWRGHRGDGEGGGVLGFVQGATGERIVTAGDDGIVLVFEA